MSKKKSNHNSTKNVTEKANEKSVDDKELVKIEANKKESEQEKDTVIHEDKSFENLFEKEMNEKKEKDKVLREKYREEKIALKEKQRNKHPFVHTFLILVLLTSLAYFIVSLFYTETNAITTLINSLLLMLFTIVFVSVAITTNRKNKNGFLFSSFILLGYFVFGILMTFGIISFPSLEVANFSGKELTEVVKWSEKNKVNVVQDYEYSDMIPEYHIINQDVAPGTKIKDISELTVAVSEGPNPGKEIAVPNMVTWESDRVLEFIKENYLSNVHVDFIESAKKVDTVIEQSKSGNMRRDEELKLIFSYGEELTFSEVKLRDLTNMSKFEAMFYLKQNHLNYEFKEVFSSKVKKGLVVKQSIEAGKMVKVDGEKIIISISKGPEIKVPDLTSMSMTEVTEWVIKNKLKLEFTDKYDDTVKENDIISANYKKGDKVAQGDKIEIVISLGKLKMEKFDDLNQFREWAEKYGIKYEEQHEFSDSVKAGEVISYSYKDGETIKNNDTIIVVISDGKESVVPNVVGSTKAQATSKLKSAGFGYNFVYACSNSVASGKAIRQSLKAGSKASEGATVTVTLSTGKCSSGSGSNSSGGSGNSGGNSGGSSGGGSTTPSCDRTKGAKFYAGTGNTGEQALASTKAQNPGFTINVNWVSSCPNGSTTSGSICNSPMYDSKWLSYCDTITLNIIK